LLFSEDKIIQAACWAHVRRKFEAIVKKSSQNGLAHQAMRYIKALFRIEREADARGVDLKTRLKIRKEQSEPLLKQFKQWLDEYYPTVSAKSPLGKAMGYAIKYWPELLTFLQDARIRLDNNYSLLLAPDESKIIVSRSVVEVGSCVEIVLPDESDLELILVVSDEKCEASDSKLR